MMAFGLLLIPFTVYPQSDQKSTGPPPVSQPLVSEGDFALKLATALKVGTPTDEAQAEDMLTSAGIAPKNGWIADYPLTPNIIGELQNSVGTAADSKKLPMEKDEALKAFQGLTTELGLAVSPGTAGQYAENQPQPDASVINNYYYEEGPPVVSYYPPPWDYDYLYAWVPYPFWCTGFFFSGFFVLHDFHRRVIFANRVVIVSNHVFDRVNNRVVVVDPVRHTWTNFSHTTAFNSTANRNAASSIFDRSMQRTAFSRGTQGMTGNHPSSFSTTQGRQSVVTNNSGNTAGTRTFSNSSGSATGGGMNHRSFQSSVPSSSGTSSSGKEGVATNNRGNTVGSTTFSNSSSSATGGGMNHRSFQSSVPSSSGSPGGGREGAATNNRGNTVGSTTFSNSSSSVTGGGMNHGSSQSFSRSFSAPSSSGSSGCVNCHGSTSSFGHSSGHSFSGSSGGHASAGFSGGHSSGGFSGGHSFGGFSGGHGGGGGRR